METLYSTGTKFMQKGRIGGVQKVGRNYLIPDNILKPQYTYVFPVENRLT